MIQQHIIIVLSSDGKNNTKKSTRNIIRNVNWSAELQDLG